MAVELGFQKIYEHLAVFELAFGLFWIVTQYVALASLAIADDNLFSLQVIFEDRLTATLAEDIDLDLRHPGHPAS